MKQKKSPKANLENQRLTFLLGGLALAVIIVYVAVSWSTSETGNSSLGDLSMGDEFEEEMINTFREKEPPPPPPEPEQPPEKKVIEELTVVENDEEDVSDLDIDSEVDEDTKVDVDMSGFEEEEEEVEPISFAVVEDKPEFPGGQAALLKHIATHTEYPEIAKENGIQGRVYIQFVIDKNGKVTNVSIARGIDPNLDKEAKRVVRNLPAWKPGKQRGKPVPVTYVVPINFKLF